MKFKWGEARFGVREYKALLGQETKNKACLSKERQRKLSLKGTKCRKGSLKSLSKETQCRVVVGEVKVT